MPVPMKVLTEIKVYEVNGKPLPKGHAPVSMRVASHPDFSDLVILDLPGGQTYTVQLLHLRQAAENIRTTIGGFR